MPSKWVKLLPWYYDERRQPTRAHELEEALRFEYDAEVDGFCSCPDCYDAIIRKAAERERKRFPISEGQKRGLREASNRQPRTLECKRGSGE